MEQKKSDSFFFFVFHQSAWQAWQQTFIGIWKTVFTGNGKVFIGIWKTVLKGLKQTLLLEVNKRQPAPPHPVFHSPKYFDMSFRTSFQSTTPWKLNILPFFWDAQKHGKNWVKSMVKWLCPAKGQKRRLVRERLSSRQDLKRKVWLFCSDWPTVANSL